MADVTVMERIHELELDLIAKKKELAELRKQVDPIVIENYELLDGNGKKVKVDELFQGYDTLIVIQNMGKSCNYCTLWADEINGILHHLESIAPVVFASSDEPKVVSEFADSRNWKFDLISTHGSEFKQALGFETKPGSPQPGVSILKKKGDGTIYQYSSSPFGPGDDFCGMWGFVDLLPESQQDWAPKKQY
ncbi:DUF899 domain-containing protein [Filobacillus milosensis]|uniref:DUF899 domain-containing protein n=1 Tax=Filobacillus milosensis TaxID=94137 RepID=A0A4Y8II83_9BACI|nr:DUF899 family protein [Filobacillus milosensis]TFB19515.1 DUF899 domain-containing protein [Filobacillus milosensis]